MRLRFRSWMLVSSLALPLVLAACSSSSNSGGSGGSATDGGAGASGTGGAGATGGTGGAGATGGAGGSGGTGGSGALDCSKYASVTTDAACKSYAAGYCTLLDNCENRSSRCCVLPTKRVVKRRSAVSASRPCRRRATARSRRAWRRWAPTCRSCPAARTTAPASRVSHGPACGAVGTSADRQHLPQRQSVPEQLLPLHQQQPMRDLRREGKPGRSLHVRW